MNKWDRSLGMGRDISRRDFINGVAVTQTATVVVNAAAASAIAINAGNAQMATVGTAVATPPTP